MEIVVWNQSQNRDSQFDSENQLIRLRLNLPLHFV